MEKRDACIGDASLRHGREPPAASFFEKKLGKKLFNTKINIIEVRPFKPCPGAGLENIEHISSK